MKHDRRVFLGFKNLKLRVLKLLRAVQDHGLEHGLDPALIARCAPALPFAGATPVPVYIEAEAVNTHRAIGTTLAHEARPPLTPLSGSARCQMRLCCS